MPKQTSHLERLEQRLAEQPLHALADRVEVGRAAIHEVAAAGLGEVGHVEPQHLAVELHAQVVADDAARAARRRSQFQTRNTPFTIVQTSTNRHTTRSVRNGVVGIQRWAAGAIQRKRAARLAVDVDVMLASRGFPASILATTSVGRHRLQRFQPLDEVFEPRLFGDLHVVPSVGRALLVRFQLGLATFDFGAESAAGSSAASLSLSSSSCASQRLDSATSRSLSAIF